MDHRAMRTAILVVGLCLAGAAGADDSSARPATLRFDPQFILATVAERLRVTLRAEVPVPAVFLESTTPLRRFQDALHGQWHFRPHVFANAYAIARNEIYLLDDARYYTRLHRTLDDSLAHEFVHYLQAAYLHVDISDNAMVEICESEAVAVQDWFRGHYLEPDRAGARMASLRAN